MFDLRLFYLQDTIKQRIHTCQCKHRPLKENHASSITTLLRKGRLSPNRKRSSYFVKSYQKNSCDYQGIRIRKGSRVQINSIKNC